MIQSIDHRGVFIDDCSLPGDTRADGVVPTHSNAIQLSEDRFLVLVSTLGFRGLDDTRSILYQVREGSYDGPVLTEGMLAKSIDDWDPFDDGRRYVRQFGHPVAFGVPRGTVHHGQVPPHANLFVIKWRTVARTLVRDGGYLLWNSEPKELTRRTQDVQWVHVQLNEAGDDLEILEPPRSLRQVGYESGEQVCEHAGLGPVNQTYVNAVPINADATEWADVCHFGGGIQEAALEQAKDRIAPLRYRYNPSRHRYEWVQTGPVMGPGLFEASVLPYRDDWVVAARLRAGVGVAWARVHDLFAKSVPELVVPNDVGSTRCPLSAYACPDGIPRLLSGEKGASPYGLGRNPLYLYDIDPDNGFRCTARRVAFDALASDLKFEKGHHPIVDMAKLFPHTGGREQLLVHRVRTAAMAVQQPDYGNAHILTKDDFASSALYYATVRYDQDYPPTWSFAPSRS